MGRVVEQGTNALCTPVPAIWSVSRSRIRYCVSPHLLEAYMAAEHREGDEETSGGGGLFQC